MKLIKNKFLVSLYVFIILAIVTYPVCGAREPEKTQLTGSYISDRETLERLVRLESIVQLKFDEMAKALILAQIANDKISSEAKRVVDERLEGLNQHRERLIRMEGTFATKEELAVALKYIYIAMGILIAVEVVIQLFIKRR